MEKSGSKKEALESRGRKNNKISDIINLSKANRKVLI